MLVAVSSARRLRARWGDDGFRRVRRALSRCRSRLARQGRDFEVLFPDDPALAARHGVTPTEVSSAADLRACLREVHRSSALPLRGVLLVGGDSIVPFHRVPNPVANRSLDPDSIVLTDNLYGRLSLDARATGPEALLLPEIPVGRLPDFGRRDLAGFLHTIDAVGRGRPAKRRGVFAVFDEAWRGSVRRILASRGSIFRSSPGWTGHDPEWETRTPELFYFNLHGFDRLPAWRGFDNRTGRWLNSLSPGQVGERQASGSVVVAENCYGANILAGTPRRSVALAFMRSGCRAFLGSTGLAFGNLIGGLRTAALRNADALAMEYVDAIFRGVSFGRALRSARARLLGTERRTSFGQKTALQFVLLGDPLATL